MSFLERIPRPLKKARTVDVRPVGPELSKDLAIRTLSLRDSPAFQEPVVRAFVEQTLRDIWQAFETPASLKAGGEGKDPTTRHQLQIRVATTLDQALEAFIESGQAPEMVARISGVCQLIQNSFSEAVMKGARSERSVGQASR